MAEREVRVDPVRAGDVPWLLAASLDPALAGEQYHWLELPLQLLIAPGRALQAPWRPACIVRVDGRRAGYVGCAPLSGNYEYLLRPWARGGVGRRMVRDFLRDHREGDRGRAFFVSHANERSMHTLVGAMADLGWTEGDDYTVSSGRFGRRVSVRAG